MKWWRMNFCPGNKTRPGVERSVRSSEQGAAGQPTGGLPLGLVGLELVSTFRRIACFLKNNQHILTYIQRQLQLCNLLTSNTLPADLGINCQSYKPGWRITNHQKVWKCLPGKGHCHRTQTSAVRSRQLVAWATEKLTLLLGSSVLLPRMELHENTLIYHVLSSRSPYYSITFRYSTLYVGNLQYQNLMFLSTFGPLYQIFICNT
jgi:hypothetical protein